MAKVELSLNVGLGRIAKQYDAANTRIAKREP